MPQLLANRVRMLPALDFELIESFPLPTYLIRLRGPVRTAAGFGAMHDGPGGKLVSLSMKHGGIPARGFTRTGNVLNLAAGMFLTRLPLP